MILLRVLNELFESGSFSVAWTHSLVYLIPKSSPGKLRPISLTSNLLKVLKSCPVLNLRLFSLSFSLAFGKNVSCLDNLDILWALRFIKVLSRSN